MNKFINIFLHQHLQQQ